MSEAGFDFHDPQMRRQLCTALTEIIYAHVGDGVEDGDDIVDLAEHTPTLTATEVEVVRAYFTTGPAANDEPVNADDRTSPGGGIDR